MIERRVLVCGSRYGFPARELRQELDALNPRPTTVIHGGARGVDSQAGEWAALRGITVEEYPADWRGQGVKAGPLRNKEMLDKGRPHLVVAFPGGKGTYNMIFQARRAGIPVVEVKP